jgi:acetyl esterase/lipase
MVSRSDERSGAGLARQPLASPIFAAAAALAQLPPTLLIVGDAEVGFGRPILQYQNVYKQYRFGKRGTDYLRESGINWMNCSAKRQCDRTLCYVEVVLEDSTRFAEALDAAGVPVTLDVYPRMWHDWVMYSEGWCARPGAAARLGSGATLSAERVQREGRDPGRAAAAAGGGGRASQRRGVLAGLCGAVAARRAGGGVTAGARREPRRITVRYS